jgi:hypothetical protein
MWLRSDNAGFYHGNVTIPYLEEVATGHQGLLFNDMILAGSNVVKMPATGNLAKSKTRLLLLLFGSIFPVKSPGPSP